MYYNEKEKRNDQVWVTLDSGEAYAFDSNEAAAKFLGNIISYNPYDYAAISSMAEVCVAMNEEIENEKDNRNRKIEEFLEARKALNYACMINNDAVYALTTGLILAGGLAISGEIFKNFSTDMLIKYADFCVNKAENEQDQTKRKLLYTEAEKSYLKGAGNMQKETKAKFEEKAKEDPSINVLKETDIDLKKNQKYQQNAKKACAAAIKAAKYSDALKAARGLDRNDRKDNRKAIKQAAKEDKYKDMTREQRKKKLTEELKAKQEKNKNKKAEGKKKWEENKDKPKAKQDKKPKNKKENPNKYIDEIRNEYIKSMTAEELKKAKERNKYEKKASDNEKNKKIVKVRELKNAAKLQAEVKKQAGLKGIEEARVKNKNTFKLRLSTAATASSAVEGKLAKDTEKIVQSGASFESVASAVASSKTARYGTAGISAEQSGAISRIAEGTEQGLKKQANNVKAKALNEEKAADMVESRVLCTVQELMKECGIECEVRKTDIKMFQNNKDLAKKNISQKS